MTTPTTNDSPSTMTDALTRRDTSAAWAVQWVLRMALGGMFLFAAWNKLQPAPSEGAMNGPQNFVASVQAFKLGLPDWALRLSTSMTPWIEVVAGLALILGIWRRSAAAVIAALLVVFIALVVSVLLRPEISVECGCFGKLSPFCPKRVGWCNIFQNGVMLSIAAYLAIAPVAPLRRAA